MVRTRSRRRRRRRSPRRPGGRSPRPPAPARPPPTTLAPRSPVAIGTGGAVASVDADATAVGLDVLRAGRQRGRRRDRHRRRARRHRAVLLRHRRRRVPGLLRRPTPRVGTIDGREAAPATLHPRRPSPTADGTALDFATVVSSGLSVGVPGTPALWDSAARRFGSRPLSHLLQPGRAAGPPRVRRRRHLQPADRSTTRRASPASPRPPGSSSPAGSRPRSARSSATRRPGPGLPDAAHARACAALYGGELGAAVVQAARRPADHRPARTRLPRPDHRGRPARATGRGCSAPTRSTYRGLDVYGMPVPSSGGIAVGEALNLLESYDREDRHRWPTSTGAVPAPLAEATATAFADRNR